MSVNYNSLLPYINHVTGNFHIFHCLTFHYRYDKMMFSPEATKKLPLLPDSSKQQQHAMTQNWRNFTRVKSMQATPPLLSPRFPLPPKTYKFRRFPTNLDLSSIELCSDKLVIFQLAHLSNIYSYLFKMRACFLVSYFLGGKENRSNLQTSYLIVVCFCRAPYFSWRAPLLPHKGNIVPLNVPPKGLKRPSTTTAKLIKSARHHMNKNATPHTKTFAKPNTNNSAKPNTKTNVKPVMKTNAKLPMKMSVKLRYLCLLYCKIIASACWSYQRKIILKVQCLWL